MVVGILLLSMTRVWASFNGIYTINKLAPASATNYRSFSSIISDLSAGIRSDSFAANGAGVSGNVVIMVIPGSGPYYENISIPEINGVSQSKRISIKGNQEILAFTTSLGALPVIQLNGADYISIDSLQIHALGTAYGRCIEIMNESNHVLIEHCQLRMPNMTGTSDFNGYIMVTNGTTRPSVFTNPGKNIVVRNNHMSALINGGPYYGIWLSQVQGDTQSSGYVIESNEIEDVYYAFIQSSYTVATEIVDNLLHNDNHTRQGYIYGISMYNYLTRCDAVIRNNRLYHFNDGSTGAFDGRYPIYVYMYGANNSRDLEIVNNVIDLRCTYYTPGIYVYALNATQSGVKLYYNTLNFDGKVKNTYAYGLYMMQLYYAAIDCRNNIFHCNWELSGPLYAGYFVPGSLKFDYNLMHVSGITGSGNVYYGYNGTSYTQLKDWNLAVNGYNNISGDPLMGDPDNQNWYPQSFWVSNKGTPVSVNTDINGKLRHSNFPDFGAFEYNLDLALLKMTATDSSVCSNQPVGVKVLVKNLSQFALRQIPLSFSVNNDTVNAETFKVKLESGDSLWLSFSSPAYFHSGANSFLVTKLNGLDDQLSNNTLSLIVQVSEAPYGGSIKAVTPFEGYANAGDRLNPDIAIPGNKLVYEILCPQKYDNSQYDSSWNLQVEWRTLSGNIIQKGFTFYPPSGLKNAQFIINPDSTLEDSMVYVLVKTHSITTGCDTLFERYVYVLPVPDVAFKVSDICMGEWASFENGTTIKHGELSYSWDFGDTFSSKDTSALFNPIYLYSNEGTFTPSLYVKIKKYPKFTFGASRTIRVNPMPVVDFIVQHACEGDPVQFFNQTQVKGGNPSFTVYEWNFGDQSSISKLFSPGHQYAEPGGYKVTLTANYLGCKATTVKNANQFAKPNASFRFTGSCSETSIQFKNETTIKSGRSGSIWDFGDGSQSFLTDPVHQFHEGGNFNIVLISVSEFGCRDSSQQTIFLKESPKADFSFEENCGIHPIMFNNKSHFPAGYEVQYIWDFNGETTSNDEHPSYQFNGTGNRYINLKVKSSNGCENNVTKFTVIRLQAQADFEAGDVCEGESVSFLNKSTVDFGELQYIWRFGDNSISSQTSPKKRYTINGNTATFLVTLVALLPNGCSDSITRAVTVNAKSNPGFEASVSGRFVQCTPVISDNSYLYNWSFGEGSRSNEISPLHEYENIDQGTFQVCLGLLNTAGCLSENCREIEINLLNIDLSEKKFIHIYPLPAKDRLFIEGIEFDRVVISDMNGKEYPQMHFKDDLTPKMISLDHFNNGMYVIRAYNRDELLIKKTFFVFR